MLKKYSDFGGGKKKKSDSEFLSYNLMLNFGEKKIVLCATKKINIPKKKFGTKQKTITPPFKLNGQSLKHCYYTHPSYGHFSLLP